MANIVITGFMGTGKTAVGRIIAEKKGYRLIDIDDEVEKSSGMKISAIFEKMGESVFRKMETVEMKKAAAADRSVIVTGGGAITIAENLELMKKAGRVVCLTAEPGEICRRLKDDDSRPLLRRPDKLDLIKNLLETRRNSYAHADYTVKTDGKTPDMIASEIITKVQENGNS